MTSPVLDRPDALALRGAQVPRLSALPDGVVSSAGVEAIECAALAGLVLDPWEELVLNDALGERADGKWAAFEVGTVVPRQNGKDAILEARELGGLFAFDERLLIHSAHEQATATEHFLRLLNLIEGTPDFDRRVMKAPRGKGSEAIELRGKGRGTIGQRIKFKTRTGGGGRGFTGDFVALNEGMMLPAAFMGALVPTMAARSMEGNPQLWYAGSAVDQQTMDHGVVLARLRARALAGVPRIAYFEWSIPGENPDELSDEDLHDIEAWALANPGLGIRISAEHIAAEVGALGRRQFAVERLGVGDWPDPEDEDDPEDRKIDPDQWEKCVDVDSELDGAPCIVFDVTPDRAYSSIAAGGRRADGLAHIEIIDHRPGTKWLINRLKSLKKHKPVAIRCDEKSPAASMIDTLANEGVKVDPINARQYADACGAFVDLVNETDLRHLNTPELNAAVEGAATRPLGDAWAWSRKKSNVDISPLVAATLAIWGHGQGKPLDLSKYVIKRI